MKQQKSNIEVRSVSSREEVEEVYELLDQVFPVGRRFFQDRLEKDSSYDRATTWIASVDGKVASTVQIFPFHSRIEDASVKIGGIGSVGTLPDYRGQGLCQAILLEQCNWMAEQQYDLSLLFAVITPFYEKFGWNIVGEPVYELPIAQVPAVNLGAYEIVPVTPADMQSLACIYEQFNASRTYSVIRSEQFWTEQLEWPRWGATAALAAWHEGKLVAYGQMSNTNEGLVHLEELCYVNGHEASVVPLLAELLQLRPDAERLSAKLPKDHALLSKLLEWGADSGKTNYAMWKIIRLQPLLAKLESVFAKRLQQSPAYKNSELYVHLSCVNQHAYIHYENGQVQIEPEARQNTNYNHRTLDQEQFITLLFQGAGKESDPALQDGLLQALFPEQNAIFYLTDKF